MWKGIKGWENYYEVNDCGDVRNKLTNKLLIGDINSIGYMRVCLYNKNNNPSKQRFFRHRLVAEHFIPNVNNLKEVNHIDGNKTHNFKNNLEWVTRLQNEHKSRQRGTKHYKPFKVIYTNEDMCVFDTKTELANILHVDRATVKCWLHNDNNGFKKYNIKEIYYI